MKNFDLNDWLCSKGAFNWMPDEMFLKMRFRKKMGRKLNLKNPQTFNEKLQWLKLYDRKPEYSRMVDKYEAKKYVAERIGEEYIIPTYGVWDSFDEIDFESLPDQFVLKCTHDSGGLVICRDKSTLDIEAAKRKINKSLKTNYYLHGREWPYKDVKPRIIAEKYMEDGQTKELRDYKFFTFNGSPKALFIATERQIKGQETKFDFFDMDFRHLDIQNGHPNAEDTPACPETFETMKKLAERIADGIPQARVDFYEVNGQTYFGEITFSHWSGMVPFEPEKWDMTFGEWIKLPEIDGGAISGDGFIIVVHSNEDMTIGTSQADLSGLTDYKLHCFNGNPRMTLVCTERFSEEGLREDFYDESWKHMDLKRPDHEGSSSELKCPKQYALMKTLAQKLAENTPFSRIDFYEIQDRIYFGEITFFPSSGLKEFEPEKWDLELGEWIKLPGGDIS